MRSPSYDSMEGAVALLLLFVVLSSGTTVDLLQYTQTNCPNSSVLVKLARCSPDVDSVQLANWMTKVSAAISSNDSKAMETFFSETLHMDGLTGNALSSVARNCSDLSKQEHVMRCSSRVMLACTDMDKADMLPDEETQVAGLHYICAHVQGLDLECIKENFLGISRCASQQTSQHIESLSSHNLTTNEMTTEVACSGFRFQIACAQHILALCGPSGDVYSNFMRYQFPLKCKVPLPTQSPVVDVHPVG